MEHVTSQLRERESACARYRSISITSADETPVTFRAASGEKAPCPRRGRLHLGTRRNDGQHDAGETVGAHPEPPEEDLDAV